ILIQNRGNVSAEGRQGMASPQAFAFHGSGFASQDGGCSPRGHLELSPNGLQFRRQQLAKPEVRMHCKHLVGLSMLLLLAASCVRDEELAVPEPADTMTPPDVSAVMPAEEAARPDGHTSKNSLDWAGTYSGVLPCADCPGIETVVALRSDGTYERSTFYIDSATAPESSNGTFTWDETANKIVLDTGDDEIVKYQVGENQLFRLDRDGQRIIGELAAHYVLKKHLHDLSIEGKRWKLVELRGKP